jgi:type I restriction enzyme S subunit
VSYLPVGWSSVQLGELTKALTKGTTPTTLGFSYQSSGVLFVKAESLADFKIVPELCAHIGNDAHEALSRSKLQAGDVLFSIAGTLGRVGVVTEADCPGNTNQALAIIRPADGRLTPFLSRFLSGPFKAALIEHGARGTGLQNLNLAQLAAAQIDVPPLAEQQRIVAKLDAISDRIGRARAELDRIPRMAARQKQALLSRYFSTGASSQDRLENITPSDAKIIYGILQPGPHVSDGVPYVRPTEIVDGVLDPGAMRRTTVEIAQRYRRSTLQAGDVLLSIVGTIGKVAIVPPALSGANITQSSCRIRPQPGKVEPRFLAYFLQSTLAIGQYDAARLGTAVPRLNLEDVRQFMMPVPPYDEQLAIVESLDAAFAQTDGLAAEAAAARRLLDRLDQAILAKAFRGELVPQDSDDEPASVLLSRIALQRGAMSAAKRRRKLSAA